jgi:hypothetical protein
MTDLKASHDAIDPGFDKQFSANDAGAGWGKL